MDKFLIRSSLKKLYEYFDEIEDDEAKKCIDVIKAKLDTQLFFDEMEHDFGQDMNYGSKDGSKDQRSNLFPLPSEIKNDGQHFALFSDGACRGNPGPGAWAAMGQGSDGEILFELSGLHTRTTNNKMELEGAIYALKELHNYFLERGIEVQKLRPVVFLYSDSRYVVEGVNSWMSGWKKRGWKKADMKAPENLELWQELDQVLACFTHIKFVWVKGHSGHPQNERCDQLANGALNEAGF